MPDAFSKYDQKMMKHAFRLARKGLGQTSPNPLVGAVLARDQQIVGTGFHACAGGDHAEVIALAEAGERARGSTLYVTLEPCCHQGRTPPCTKAIIAAGVARVVAAMADPNPLVAGHGLKELTAAGIQVECGLFEKTARQINEVFIKYITTGRPFITLKAAVSLDGKIATASGNSCWITGSGAREYVHNLRLWSDGVMVGVGTILKDNSNLTCRVAPSRGESGGIRQPLRIVVDSHGRTPVEANVLKNQHISATLIAVAEGTSAESIRRLRGTGAEVHVVPSLKGQVDLKALTCRLGAEKITSILLEGGGTLNAAAVQAGLVDKFQIFIAPKLIGGGSAPTFLEGTGIEWMKDARMLTVPSIRSFGQDLLLTAYPRNR